MITVNELRIGNLFSKTVATFNGVTAEYSEIICEVKGVENVCFSYCGNEVTAIAEPGMNPIPLTTENIFKQDVSILKELFDFTFIINGSGQICASFNEKGYLILKHVHQLQNLYFALVGEELKINL